MRRTASVHGCWGVAAAVALVTQGVTTGGAASSGAGAPAASVVPTPPPSVRLVALGRPALAAAGLPLTVPLELSGPARAVTLHWRAPGAAGFVAHAGVPERGLRWWVTLGAEQLTAGLAEWYLEVTDAEGRRRPLVGTRSHPEELEVRAAPPSPPPPAPRRVVARAWVDAADFNRLRGNDTALQTEGDVGLEGDAVGLRALRLGFGVYRGRGGNLAELDERHLPPREVGLTYGALELELGVSEQVGLVARGSVGLVAAGVAPGGQALLRLGPPRATNLVIGGELLGGVGYRLAAELAVEALPRVPVRLRAEVGDQPAGGAASAPSSATSAGVSTGPSQTGARAVVAGGYRVLPGLALFLRVSWQGRTIDHSGPGAGAGVEAAW